MPIWKLAIIAQLLGGAALADAPELLTDPFLQLPTEDGVHVVWFTEFEGTAHSVIIGERTFDADTTKLSRVAEDAQSYVAGQDGDGSVYSAWTPRDIWRHAAYVDGIAERTDYHVHSFTADGDSVESETYTLAPLPAPGQPLRILLTSDHQLKDMVPANLQKVEETVGRLDAIFFAGDLQVVPDRASEWFDDSRGLAFFPTLQGRADFTLTRGEGADARETTYRGAALIQHAPLFPVIGNHEVMGRFIPSRGLTAMYTDPRPRNVAEALYETHAEVFNPSADPGVRDAWIRNNSHNSITYEEIFTLPDDGPEGKRYYALRFGDVFMIGLNASRIWRPFRMTPKTRGKYREAEEDLGKPDEWGWGEFIFTDMAEGSEQYNWLKDVLASEEFRAAPIKVAIMHQPVHGLGDNSLPVFAHPVQILDYDDDGRLTGVRYDYPLDADIFVRDVEPLLTQAGVRLVHTGHSNVWYRTISPEGVAFLETSNVGNTYGCYLEGVRARENMPDDPRFDVSNYPATGDPHGYEPQMPSEFAPMTTKDDAPLPCVASDLLTVFSVLETDATGASVSSYVYDTSDPGSPARLFDRFAL